MPPSASKGGGCRKRVRYFLQHEIYKNSVSSVEAEMGMEGQIVHRTMHILDVTSPLPPIRRHCTGAT